MITIMDHENFPMKRFNWAEMQEYWRLHSHQWSAIDFEQDPDGLANVVMPGAPLWLNRHFDRLHKLVYEKLFSEVPAPRPGARALDLGCGAGRWSRFLSEHGYRTTGIDLQPDLIEMNRKRFPGIEFHQVAIQDFSAPEPFDLISTVTVIQHVPFEEHDRIIAKISALLRPGGYALVLENILDQFPNVFSHRLAEWQAKFEQAGLRCLRTSRFNYDLFIRLHRWMAGKTVSALRPGRDASEQAREAELTPEKFVNLSVPAEAQSGKKSALHTLNHGAQRLAVLLDALVEPVLIRLNPGLTAAHCGFLFRREK